MGLYSPKRGETRIDMKQPITHTMTPQYNTFSGFLLLIPNLNIELYIAKQITGIRSWEKVKTKSAVPYSSRVNTWVYNGTKKKIIILDPKSPKAKTAVSLNSFLYFDKYLDITS